MTAGWHYATLWSPPYIMLVRSTAPYTSLPAVERKALRDATLQAGVARARRRDERMGQVEWSIEQTEADRMLAVDRVMRTDR